MYFFPNIEPVHRSMPSSNYFFLTCIQFSQETGKVVWYSHLFKNFPRFVVIHTIEGFGVVNEAGVDGFLKFLCFFCGLTDVGNLISGSCLSQILCTSGSSQFMYCWSLAWRILSMTLLAWEMSAIVQWFGYSLVLPFLGIWMRIDLF